MRVIKGTRIIAGAVMFAILAACAGGSGSRSDAAPDRPVRMSIGEPQNLLIPGNTKETEGSEVLGALFTPLVSYDEDKKPFEDAAESITSSDNRIWTIKLKPGFTWHNGEPVVAQNYVDAWNYVANQANAQAGNHFFSRIAGYAELNPGRGERPAADRLRGLRVIDERTFQVTLSEPFSQFKAMLGYTAFYPLPRAAFGPDGRIAPWYGEQPIGQGLFKMDRPYRKGVDQTIELSVYDRHPGPKPKFRRLQFKIYTNLERAYEDLLAGDIDIMDQLPSSVLGTARARLGERFIDLPDAGVGYIGTPLKYNKVYSDPKVRKAISMAIDRKTITEVVFSGSRVPADDFINPAIDGYRQGICGEPCMYDPAKARQLYIEANGPKKIELGYNSDGPHREWVEAVGENLRRNLNVEVTVKAFDKFGTILDQLDANKYGGLFRMGWVIDYPSAENFLTPVFSTAAIAHGQNFGGYSNKEFDELIKKGDAARTPEEGLKYYQMADDILIRDLPYIPVYFYRLNAAYSHHLKNVQINLRNQVDWLSIEWA
jgi:ABC-type oligopeptide transport system, periplasmic component